MSLYARKYGLSKPRSVAGQQLQGRPCGDACCAPPKAKPTNKARLQTYDRLKKAAQPIHHDEEEDDDGLDDRVKKEEDEVDEEEGPAVELSQPAKPGVRVWVDAKKRKKKTTIMTKQKDDLRMGEDKIPPHDQAEGAEGDGTSTSSSSPPSPSSSSPSASSCKASFAISMWQWSTGWRKSNADEKKKTTRKKDGCCDEKGACREQRDDEGAGGGEGGDEEQEWEMQTIDVLCCRLCVQGECCVQECCFVLCCVKSHLTKTGSTNRSASSAQAAGGGTVASFEVEGITCADCSESLHRALRSHRAVRAVQINIFSGKTDVTFDPAQISATEVKKMIDKAGFKARPMSSVDATRVAFKVDGLWPPNDALSAKVEGRDGVHSVVVDRKRKSLTIQYDPDVVGARTLKREIEESHDGLHLVPDSSGRGDSASPARRQMIRLRRRFILSALFGIPVLLIAFVFPHIPRVDDAFHTSIVRGLKVEVLVNWILATPIQFLIAWPLYVSAYKGIRHARTLNMDSLVMLSTTTAYVYSVISVILAMSLSSYSADTFFETCAVLLMLILLGRFLEALAKGKTCNVLAKLTKLQASTAILLESRDGDDDPLGEGSDRGLVNSSAADDDVHDLESNTKERDMYAEQEIDVGLVQLGDLLKVLPGARIPTDGTVESGTTTVDESMLTGESMPVTKQPGDLLFGGSVNQQGTIHMRATKVTSASTLATIARLVEDAQAAKPAVQRIADRIAAVFIPFILLVAIGVFAVWCALAYTEVIDNDGVYPIAFALRFAIAVLVISCPCAIGLAVPTPILIASGVAAGRGILFKSGPVLETYHKVKAIAFDKTGTLTRGEPSVTAFHLLSSDDAGEDKEARERRILYLVGSAERGSEHVIAKAIAKYAEEQLKEPLEEPQDFHAEPGRGLSCTVAGANVIIGNQAWVQEAASIENLPDDVQQVAAHSEQEGHTVVWAAVDGHLVATLALADSEKPEAAAVVRRLQKMKISVWMLSGDNPRTVAAMAEKLGIQSAEGGLLPAQKLDRIAQLQRSHGIVAMVGDGINDSPALAKADVGIAIGAGSDIAAEAADVVLVRSNLADVLLALDLSKTTFRRIKLNFCWAFLYNFLAIPFAAGLLYPFTDFVLPPAAAGLAELVSALPVLLFSVLLRFYRTPRSIRSIDPSLATGRTAHA